MASHPMIHAWRWYRSYARLNNVTAFNRVEFAHCLRRSFHDYRGELAREAWTAEQAAMTPVERRVSAIEAELARLTRSPWGVDIALRKSALAAEMAAIRAEINTQRDAA